MNVPDLDLARKLARICACIEFADNKRRAIASNPHFALAGFTDLPSGYVVDNANACILGTIGSQVVLAFGGLLPLSYATKDAFLNSVHAWLSDSDLQLIPVNGVEGLVQRGVADALLQLWPLFMEDLQERLSGGKKLIVAGHSKGGAVAALAASRLVGMELAEVAQLYTFAAPRAGDRDFATSVMKRVRPAWRFEYRDDPVPHLPAQEQVTKVLREHHPHLRALQLPHFAPVGSLEFINGRGQVIAGSGTWLDFDRAGRLAYFLSAGKTEQIGADHSLEKSYLPAIGRLPSVDVRIEPPRGDGGG